jgi:hypothetical protein
MSINDTGPRWLTSRRARSLVLREVAERFSLSTRGPYRRRATAQHGLGRNDDVIAVCRERQPDLLAALVRRGGQQRYGATAAQRSVRLPATVRPVPLPSASIVVVSRPTLVKLNGPGGSSVGALNPIAPP